VILGLLEVHDIRRKLETLRNREAARVILDGPKRQGLDLERDESKSSCPRIAVRRTASLRSAYVAGIHVLSAP